MILIADIRAYNLMKRILAATILMILLLGMLDITGVAEAYSVVDEAGDLRWYDPGDTPPDVEVPQEVIDEVMSLSNRIDIIGVSSEIDDGGAYVRIRFSGPALTTTDMASFLGSNIHFSLGGHVWYKYRDTQLGLKFEVSTMHVTEEVELTTIIKSPEIPTYELDVAGRISIEGDEITFSFPLVGGIDWSEVEEYSQEDGSQIVIGITAQLGYYYNPQIANKKLLEDLVIIRAAELGVDSGTGEDRQEPVGDTDGSIDDDTEATEPVPPVQPETPGQDSEPPSEEPSDGGGGIDPLILIGIGVAAAGGAALYWLRFMRGGA